MRQVLTELFDLLSQQRDLLEKMLELSREEREVIINGQAEQLEQIVRQELRELSKLSAIEKKRQELGKSIASELGLAEQDLSVTAIVESVGKDEGEGIRQLQAELTALISQHTDLNRENRALVEAHIEYSDAFMEIMVDTEDPLNNFYGGDGKAATEKKKATGFFDGHA